MARMKTAKQQLAEKFPTISDIEKTRINYTSWAQMAKAIGISKASLYEYRSFLGMKMEIGGKKPNNFCLANKKETDDLIKALMEGKSKNIVKVYQITKPNVFYQDPRGYKGLKYVRTEQGTSWAALRHQVSAVGGRGQ